MRERAHIVGYDIGEARRRVRVARRLAASGERVQKSVFVCRLTPTAARRLEAALRRMMAPGDSLIVEPVAGRGFERPEALIL